MTKTITALICAALLAGCAATMPKPGPEHRRPSLSYRVDASRRQAVKYPLRVGIATARDRRGRKFYRGQDNFFTEQIPDALSNSIYYELTASGLFDEVIRIKETMPLTITQAYANSLREKYNVEMLLLVDITHFSLLRSKTTLEMATTDRTMTNDFEIEVVCGMIGQLIYLKKSFIVWADEVKRSNKAFAEKGALESADLARLTHKSTGQAIGDMVLLIKHTGKRMQKR